MTLICPAPGCVAEATVLEADLSTGEIVAWCADHPPEPTPGWVVLACAGPLHSTSLFTR